MKYAASPDIKKAHRQILVSYEDSILGLSFHLVQGPIKKEGLIIYRTSLCDFGDAQASLALRVLKTWTNRLQHRKF